MKNMNDTFTHVADATEAGARIGAFVGARAAKVFGSKAEAVGDFIGSVVGLGIAIYQEMHS